MKGKRANLIWNSVWVFFNDDIVTVSDLIFRNGDFTTNNCFKDMDRKCTMVAHLYHLDLQ